VIQLVEDLASKNMVVSQLFQATSLQDKEVQNGIQVLVLVSALITQFLL